MRKTAIIAALSLLLTLVCPVWIFQPAQGNTLAFSGSLNTVAGGAGDRVTLTVNYDGSLDSIGAFLTRVDYDASCFEYVRTEASAVLGMGYVVTRPGDGTVSSAYTMANSRTSLTDAGETFTYVFRVREDAPSVEASFYLRVYDAVDPAAQPINTELRQELSFAVEAPPSADASLLMLYSEEGDLSPDFSPDQHAYTMTVPYATTSVTFYAEAAEGAIFRVNRKNLGPGGSDTEFIITVTAEDGKTKQEYTVIVHREAKATPPPSSTDASLSMLYSEEGELTPAFSPDQREYTMTVPYEVTSVTFYAEAAEGATYRVNRKNLGPGGSDTEFIITVTAEDGKTKQEYTVTVHREAKATPSPSSTDASLAMLYSEEGELSPDFSPDQHEYKMTVPYEVTSVTFYAEAVEGATFRVNRKNLGPGGSDTEFIITVTAEDGKTKQEYTVTIHREAKAPTPTPDPLQADASLITLYSEEGELTPDFSPDQHEYNMTVPYAVTTVTFYAEAAEGATYRVNRKNLGPGGSDTEFIITVTAEDGKTKQEYTVTVHREAKATPPPSSTDASLAMLYSEEGELSPTFSPDLHEYTMTVPYAVTSVTFYAEAAEGATYRVNRKNLGPGGSDTEFIITVTAEDGKTKQEYTVTVHREAKAPTPSPDPLKADASLLALYSEEGELTPDFSPDQHEYKMTVPYAVTSVTFYAEAAEGATYRVNRKNLGPGGSDTEFIIAVTAEDGKTKQEYTVTVHREAKSTPPPSSTDASLAMLYSEEGELTPAFSPDQHEYKMTVPYEVTSVTFYAEAAEGATYRVNRKNLGPGGSDTEFIITVTAEDGKTKQEYSVTVHREAKATPPPSSTDASLAMLYSEEGDLTPDFSPDQHEYTMTVPYEITSVTFYAEAAEGATYRVNRKNLGPGGSDTEFIITVTAEDGKTKQEYTVTVHREAKAPTPTPDPLKADASLLTLYSEEGELTPAFSPDQHEYTMTVPYETTTVSFSAETAEGATYRVNRKNLGPGGSDTEFIITVTAEDGKTKQEYTVTVHREAKAPTPTPDPLKTDASLLTLYSEEGELTPDFSPDQHEYTMTVPYEVTSVTFYAEAAEGATYRVNRKNLGPGGSDTEFIITVTAEDGKTKQEYTVTVHREAKATPVPSSTDASLSKLYSEEGELSPAFSPEQLEYKMTVPYETTTVPFSAETAEGATYRMNRKNLGPGGSDTEFIITVTAEDGKTKQEYTVTVHREAKAPTPIPDPLKADASLITLYSEEGELTPDFSPDQHEYTMTVPYETTTVSFSAETAEGATYRVNRKNLGPGGSDTEFIITVTAEDGKTKQEYTVTVHREAKAPTPTPDPLKADASLLTLYSEEGDLSPVFSPEQHEYTMTVPYDTTSVTFYAEATEGATYRVNRKNLGPGGSDTEFVITVTAEDGKTKQEYKVTVHREAKATPVPSSADASLAMLYSEEGELTPAFSPDLHEYTMTVPYAVTSVTFYAEAAEGATYRVNRKNLGPGGSDTEFIITVTAEDGKTKQEYKVTVHREAKATPVPSSTDASLAMLYSEEGELTPDFSPDQHEYTMTVPYETTTVSFYAETAEGATYRVNRKNLGPGGSDTEFIITVTAEDGKTKQEYTVTVHREAKAPTPTPDPLKADASLITLYSEEGELTPAFSPEQLEYTMTVPYATTSITFYAEAAEGATYRVNRKNLGPGGSDTEFIITVTAEDGKTKQEYTVTVHREAKAPTPTPDPLKADASLITLYSEEGELNPTFSPEQLEYKMTVPYETTTVSFSAETAEGATYRVNRKNLGPGGSDTAFIITVTAEDGKTKQEYTVTVHREAKAPTPTPDPLKADASLLTLYSEEGELNPAFSPEQLEYKMTVPYETTTVSFSAETAEGATYRVNRKNLGPGGSESNFEITVTAADGQTKQTYTVLVHREAKAATPKPALTPKPTATSKSKSTATPKPAATAKSTAGGSTKTAAPQSTPAAGKIVVPDSPTQSPTATPMPTATAPPVSAATDAPTNTADASPQPIVLRAGNSASAAPVVVGILMLGGSILVAGPLAGKLPGIGRKNPKDP